MVFLHLQAGAQDRALARVAELRKSRPRDADVMALEGDLFTALARHREAAAAYDAAWTATPSRTLALRSLAARTAAGVPEPTRALESWVRDHADDLDARTALADAWIRGGDLARASAQLRAVLDRQPQHVVALNNLAWIYHEQGDARALTLARQAQSLAPSVAAVNDTLGWILAERSQFDEAVVLLERAAGARDATPTIRYHFGVVLARSGDPARARRVIEELLESGAQFAERPAASRLLQEISKGAAPGA
jgi:Tfp pilus assembly protein PilF